MRLDDCASGVIHRVRDSSEKVVELGRERSAQRWLHRRWQPPAIAKMTVVVVVVVVAVDTAAAAAAAAQIRDASS